jgi:hypothetical protein
LYFVGQLAHGLAIAEGADVTANEVVLYGAVPCDPALGAGKTK